MQINANQKGRLPKVDAPEPFASKDGRLAGWKVTIPGGRPLATPAVVDGRVFLGGGFGSHEFYAFDADDRPASSGSTRPSDDGPTAAVVAGRLRRLQHRELRAGGPHRRGQAGLEEVARRPADEHAGRRRRPGLHGLPRQPGRPPALPRLLRPADRQGALEAADRRRDHHRPGARRRPRLPGHAGRHGVLFPPGRRRAGLARGAERHVVAGGLARASATSASAKEVADGQGGPARTCSRPSTCASRGLHRRPAAHDLPVDQRPRRLPRPRQAAAASPL